jgi:phosphopantetheinyl transferase
MHVGLEVSPNESYHSPQPHNRTDYCTHEVWSIILNESCSTRTLGTRQLIEVQTSKQGQPIFNTSTT